MNTPVLSPEQVEIDKKQEQESTFSGPTAIGASILAEMYQGLEQYTAKTEQTVTETYIEQDRSSIVFNSRQNEGIQSEIRFDQVKTQVDVVSSPNSVQNHSQEIRTSSMPAIPKDKILATTETVITSTAKKVKTGYKEVMQHIIKDLFIKDILGIVPKKKEKTPEEQAKEKEHNANKRSFYSSLRESAAVFLRRKQEDQQKEAQRLSISMTAEQITSKLSGAGKIVRNLSFNSMDSIYALHALSHAQKVAQREEAKKREQPVAEPSKKKTGPMVEFNRNKQEGLNTVQKLHG